MSARLPLLYPSRGGGSRAHHRNEEDDIYQQLEKLSLNRRRTAAERSDESSSEEEDEGVSPSRYQRARVTPSPNSAHVHPAAIAPASALERAAPSALEHVFASLGVKDRVALNAASSQLRGVGFSQVLQGQVHTVELFVDRNHADIRASTQGALLVARFKDHDLPPHNHGIQLETSAFLRRLSEFDRVEMDLKHFGLFFAHSHRDKEMAMANLMLVRQMEGRRKWHCPKLQQLDLVLREPEAVNKGSVIMHLAPLILRKLSMVSIAPSLRKITITCAPLVNAPQFAVLVVSLMKALQQNTTCQEIEIKPLFWVAQREPEPNAETCMRIAREVVCLLRKAPVALRKLHIHGPWWSAWPNLARDLTALATRPEEDGFGGDRYDRRWLTPDELASERAFEETHYPRGLCYNHVQLVLEDEPAQRAEKARGVLEAVRMRHAQAAQLAEASLAQQRVEKFKRGREVEPESSSSDEEEDMVVEDYTSSSSDQSSSEVDSDAEEQRAAKRGRFLAAKARYNKPRSLAGPRAAVRQLLGMRH